MTPSAFLCPAPVQASSSIPTPSKLRQQRYDIPICKSHPPPKLTISNPSRRDVLKQIVLTVVAAPLAFPTQTHSAAAAAPDTKSSFSTAFFDISIAGTPRGRITVKLFKQDAPASVSSFEEIVKGTLRNRSGRTVSYRYSLASRVIPKTRVHLGRVNQIDSLNQSPGTPQRQQAMVDYPINSDSNELLHDRPGLLSIQKGGSFEFVITAKADPTLDETNTVIGEVVDGMDVVDALVNVPINRKTFRDGYRSVGKAIGDARANVQLEDRPLQKIKILECGLL